MEAYHRHTDDGRTDFSEVLGIGGFRGGWVSCGTVALDMDGRSVQKSVHVPQYLLGECMRSCSDSHTPCNIRTVYLSYSCQIVRQDRSPCLIEFTLT